MAAVLLILCLSTGLSNYIKDVYASSLESLQMTATSTDGSQISNTHLETINNLSGVSSVIQTHTHNSSTFDYGTDIEAKKNNDVVIDVIEEKQIADDFGF